MNTVLQNPREAAASDSSSVITQQATLDVAGLYPLHVARTGDKFGIAGSARAAKALAQGRPIRARFLSVRFAGMVIRELPAEGRRSFLQLDSHFGIAPERLLPIAQCLRAVCCPRASCEIQTSNNSQKAGRFTRLIDGLIAFISRPKISSTNPVQDLR